jgi:hypothetical protein
MSIRKLVMLTAQMLRGNPFSPLGLFFGSIINPPELRLLIPGLDFLPDPMQPTRFLLFHSNAGIFPRGLILRC